MRNAYKILVIKSEGKRSCERPGIDGRIILKCLSGTGCGLNVSGTGCGLNVSGTGCGLNVSGTGCGLNVSRSR